MDSHSRLNEGVTYGHTFKMLGYDRLKNEYVRLASSILKESSLEKIEYKE